jgi:thioredoxin reductase (NADPH)
MDYELAIVGAGPAGYSAGIYAVRAGIRTVLFDKGDGGGLAAIAPNIENYAGFPSITGMDLMEKMKDHAKRYVDIHLYEEVESIEIKKTDNTFLLKTSEEKAYSVGAVLLATGTEHRKLDGKGSKEFEGRGVSYCATCDGFFFKDKNVGVVGGGNSALIEAIYLKQIGCNHVYLIHRRDQLRAEEAYEHDAKKAGVEFLLNKVIREIKGNEKVESIVLEDTKTSETSTVDVDGIFVSIGVIPQNEIAKKLGVDIDEYGYIKVDKQMRTNVKGVYAAGDIAGGLRQIITAAAEGAIAALTSTEALGKQYPY